MSDRTYRTILGLLILLGMYFELHWLMYGLIVLLLLEGVSNLRIPLLVCKVRNCIEHEHSYVYEGAGEVEAARFSLEAERLWRLVVGCFLYLGYVLFDALWFFPWFMGFAIFGAGLSGICPVLLAIRWLGFR